MTAPRIPTPPSPVARPRTPKADRRFYTWTAIALLAIVFAGFARTFYLKAVFGTPALPVLLHAHGFVMTLWFALFFTQARLIAAHRVDLHRRLGVFGAVLAVMVAMVATMVIVEAQRRDFRLGHPKLGGMAFQLSIVVVFAVLVGAAILLRRRSDYHKRLMLLACFSILSPAIVRIPLRVIESGGVFSLFGLLDLCIILCVMVDTFNHRRLHPPFGWGAPLVIASQPLSLVLGATATWIRFARWLVS